MKKFIPIVLGIILLFGIIDYKYTQNRYKDITYAVENYLTSNLFNTHKLTSVDTIQLSFSDPTVSVLTITGTQKSSPHRKVTYKIVVEKEQNGTWKVIRVYPIN
jgi:hypothetical protein